MFVTFPQNPTAKHLNYRFNLKDEGKQHNACVHSKNTLLHHRGCFHSWILHSLQLAAGSLHWWVKAGHLLAVRGYQDSLLLRSPRLWSGLQNAQCTSVHAQLHAWIRTYRRKEISLLNYSAAKQPIYGGAEEDEALQSEGSQQAVSGSIPAGEDSRLATSDGILPHFSCYQSRCLV